MGGRQGFGKLAIDTERVVWPWFWGSVLGLLSPLLSAQPWGELLFGTTSPQWVAVACGP